MGDPGTRVRRTTAEKRRIVELTFLPGASVARVAQAEGVNSHQVFQWRRAYRNGELVLGHGSSATLLPVLLSSECATPAMPHDQEVQESEVETSTQDQTAAVSAAIHIELPGRALISVDGGADPILVRTILESLRK
jgi:transposase